MSDERDTPQEVSPLPDSISNLDSVESVSRCSPVVSAVPNSTQTSSTGERAIDVERHAESPLLPDSSPNCQIVEADLKASGTRQSVEAHPPIPVSIAPSEILLSGSSISAFRPFVMQGQHQPSTTTSNSSSQFETRPIMSTPVSRRSERSTTLPGAPLFSALQTSNLSSPLDHPLCGEIGTVIINSNINDENDDGRTTASAPPCTPVPEIHQQPQSPFRNMRQIKKIDLLAMSRSRQSDRAENARRDGRLAPSPRKKDEVLRSNGFSFPPLRTFGCPSTLRQHNHISLPDESELSPERAANRSSSTASPNVDVVSVDDHQPDPTKRMFGIQLPDMSPGEQMMKCNLCGFVTNNSRFYRRHRRLHNRQHHPSLIHCSLCEYSTTQIRKMREHSITHHHISHFHHGPSSSTCIGASASGTAASTGSSSDQGQATAAMLGAAAHHFQPPQLGGHLLVNTASAAGSNRNATARTNFILPATDNQPINLGPTATIAPAPQPPISAASTLGLPTYIPAPMDEVTGLPPPHPDPSTAGLQHPPRGSALIGNYPAEQQQQMASYMQSVLSNIMSTPVTNQGSISSSSVLMQVADGGHLSSATHHNHSLSSTDRDPSLNDSYNLRRFWAGNAAANPGSNGSMSLRHPSGFLKVKSEPIHLQHHQHHLIRREAHDLPSSTQKDRLSRRESRRRSDPLDSESGMDMSSDDPANSPQPPSLQRPRLGSHIRADTGVNTTLNSSNGSGDAFNVGHHSVTNVNGRNSQCPMPFIKIEFPPHRETCGFNYLGFSTANNTHDHGDPVLVDREVQCEILSTNSIRGSGGSRQAGGRTQSETVSSAGSGQASTGSATSGGALSSGLDTHCYFCGVTFDDEVLFSIHVGCHSHSDPFICNVCGKQCHNKYGFYSHIMRGHQARQNT